jgi:hypothetical protein
MNRFTKMETTWQREAVVPLHSSHMALCPQRKRKIAGPVSALPWDEPEGSTGVTQSTVRTLHDSIWTPKPYVLVCWHERRSMVRSNRMNHMPTYLSIDQTLVLTSELFTSNLCFELQTEQCPILNARKKL